MSNNDSFDNEPSNVRELLNSIFGDIIGNNLVIKTTFGKKPCIYLDFTASGRANIKIEESIIKNVLPYFSNIHSSGVCLPDKIQLYRNKSKNDLRSYVNADPEKDRIIFTGQGTTSAINKLKLLLRIEEYAKFYEILHILKSIKGFLISMDFQKIVETMKVVETFEDLFPKERTPFNSKVNPRSVYSTNDENFITKLLDDIELFKPIIFYTNMEHNSNYLPWKNQEIEMIQIKNYGMLNDYLYKYKDNYIKIGSFTAASNITGKLTDVDQLAVLMHYYGGLAFFDYASGAPYLHMDMNSLLPKKYREELGFKDPTFFNDKKIKNLAYKDGLFFSPHKFVGGNNTPGVLICKENIINNLKSSPSQPGGGTVLFVTKDNIHYTPDVEAREESGTPDSIGNIRIGLAINLRSKISHINVAVMDRIINIYVIKKLNNIENLKILKDFDDKTPHLPIYSFLISYKGKFFHQNFICCLLNDLFGIQSRPGCSCAPLYTQYLLSYNNKNVNIFNLDKLEYYSTHDKSIFKPGFTRINFPYFYPKFIIDYALYAIEFVAQHAHQFLPFYSFDIKTGNYTAVCDNFNMSKKNTFTFNKDMNNFEKISAMIDSTKKSAQLLLKKIDSFIHKNEKIQDNIKNQKSHFDDESNNFRWFVIYDDIEEGKYKAKIDFEYNKENFENFTSFPSNKSNLEMNLIKIARSLGNNKKEKQNYEKIAQILLSYVDSINLLKKEE